MKKKKIRFSDEKTLEEGMKVFVIILFVVFVIIIKNVTGYDPLKTIMWITGIVLIAVIIGLILTSIVINSMYTLGYIKRHIFDFVKRRESNIKKDRKGDKNEKRKDQILG